MFTRDKVGNLKIVAFGTMLLETIELLTMLTHKKYGGSNSYGFSVASFRGKLGSDQR